MIIEAKTLERQGRATTNLDRTMPPPQSDLAHQMVKDSFLGAGIAFVGRQVHLDVGGDDFYIDLLFYHLKLRAYVVIEIKSGKFKPDTLGSWASI